MDTQAVSYIAVDVAKDALRIQTTRKGFDVVNSAAGIGALLRQTRELPDRHFVCEASGGYERPLVEALQRKGHIVSLVSAARVRDFARSEGTKAKTVPIDGRMILRFAQEKRPAPTPPPSPRQRRLTDLLDRREQLTEMLKREKTRLQKPACAKEVERSQRRFVRLMEKEIDEIETLIGKLIAEEEDTARAFEELTRIKGVGALTAWTLIVYLPEITSASRSEIAALAGLAPFNRESGKTKTLRRIFGGRAKVRRVLYMAACVAALHNEIIPAYVVGLCARGKSYKWAIVAAMRKLLLHAQSCLKKHQISLA